MVLNLAHKPSFMSYRLHICLEQNHIVWLPSIKLGPVKQSSSKPDKAVKNCYLKEIWPVQGDTKIWKGAVEITRSPPVSGLRNLWFNSWQSQKEGRRPRCSIEPFLPVFSDTTDHMHLQRNDHSCYGLPHLGNVEYIRKDLPSSQT